MNLTEFRRILRQTLLFPIVLLLALAGFFLLEIQRFSAALHALDRSDQITSQIIGLEKLIVDQETGLRGFQLTGNPVMLTPYTAGSGAIQTSFADLRSLLAGNEEQEQRLKTLDDRYEKWFQRSKRTITKNPAVAKNPQTYLQNKAMMDSIRAAANDMLIREDARRAVLSETAPHLERSELTSILTASLFIGLAVALFTRERLSTVSTSYNAALEEAEEREHELHESRLWFQTTLESIGDAVIACDVQGRVEFLNAVASGLTEWSAREALGRPLNEVFRIMHEESRKTAENPVDRVRRLKKVVTLSNRTLLISRQGKECMIEDSAAPIMDEKGEMTGMVLVFHDVTEQRRTEAALIAGEKLAVAGRIAASIAHEIHNPLDSVTNLLFLLREEKDPAQRTEYLRLAEQELNRTMQISRTMLSLYRESKSPVPVDLQELIEGVLLLLERRIGQQEVKVEKQLMDSCVVEGFPAELRQVMTNVVVNAIEAAGPQGRIRIRLEAAPAEEFRAAGAMIEVMDSGPGLAEKSGQRLFQPFFTTKGEHGTGLGLWVSMGIVQKHGGMIQLQNCENDGYGGACARIYLPARTLLAGPESMHSQRAAMTQAGAAK